MIFNKKIIQSKKIVSGLSLILGVYYSAILIFSIYIIGLENLLIFFKSRYWLNFFLIYFTAIVLIILFLYLFFKLIKTGRISLYAGRLIFLIALLSISGSIYFFRLYDEFVNGKSPTASGFFDAEAGPFLQFGPFDPYLNTDTSSSAVVWWVGNKKSSGNIAKIGQTPDLDKMTSVPEISEKDSKRHEVHFKNLKENMKYYYNVPGFDSKIYSFTTSPKNQTKSFHILCMGDEHDTGKRGGSFSGEINRAASIYYSEKKIQPAFKLNLGDIVYKGRDLYSWKRFFDNEKIHSTVYQNAIALGNHELLEDYGGNFRYFFNQPLYYSFDYGKAHFLIINIFDGPVDTAVKKQIAFIRKDLEKNSGKKWIIVSLHTPILSSGDYNINNILIDQFFELFRKYRVDMVLAGHDHHFGLFHVDKEKDWGGTMYLINGTGGAILDGYIMLRKENPWKYWIHDRKSQDGLFQKDDITSKYHVYEELSWGFLDIEIGKDFISAEYFRWMDIMSYLKMSGQDVEKWILKNPDPDLKQPLPDKAAPVFKIIKKRKFE